MTQQHRGRSTRLLAALCSAGLCAAALSACDATGTPAHATASPVDYLPQPRSSDKPLLRCTSAQEQAASGTVDVLPVISSQTVHVTVGERVDITPNFAPVRPGGTGIGELWIRAGQPVICQSGNVEGRFPGRGGEPGQRLPLIITKAGRAEIQILAGVEAGNSPAVRRHLHRRHGQYGQ